MLSPVTMCTMIARTTQSISMIYTENYNALTLQVCMQLSSYLANIIVNEINFLCLNDISTQLNDKAEHVMQSAEGCWYLYVAPV